MYTLAFYETIATSLYSYELPTNIMNNICVLHAHLGVNTHHNKHKNTDTQTRRSKHESAELWKKKEIFKATVLVKKEGADVLFGDLKKYLNKMTTANYDVQKNNAIETINSIIKLDEEEAEEDEDDDNSETKTKNKYVSQIVDTLLHVACSNQYYSMLYAELYVSIMSLHEYFASTCTVIYDKLVSALDKIEFVDPNIDYNKYCIVNKQNDERRALMLFIVNSYKNSVFTIEQVSDIAVKIIKMIDDSACNTNDIEQINELTEIMNIFVTNMHAEIKNNDCLLFIKEKIDGYSKYKTKEYPGMSSRTIFKYMDMMDLLK